VAVTGASGFIGRALCRHLCQTGHQVVALTRRELACEGIQTVRFTGSPAEAFQGITLKAVDAMVHLLARTHRGESIAASSQREFDEINVKATQAAYRLAVRAGARQFIFMSSSKVFGERSELGVDGTPRRFKSSDPAQPQGPYGATKLAAERWLTLNCETDGINLTILRPPLVYGPGMRGNLHALMWAIWYSMPLPFASIVNLRSLIHRDNLVAAVSRALTMPNLQARIFTLADLEVSTPDLTRLLAHGLRRRPLLWSCPSTLMQGVAACTGQQAALARLTDSLVVERSEASRLLGWQPQLDPAQAFELIGDAFRAERA